MKPEGAEPISHFSSIVCRQATLGPRAPTPRYTANRKLLADPQPETGTRAAAQADTAYGAFALARERALAGDREAALQLLRRALAVGFADAGIETVPEFRDLRGDPDFEALVAEVKNRIAGDE